ncbi:hypothetical protein BBK82_40665 [Lentzea guizhouensis]|uniref:TIR domain-containing protein n=1 Tax=Lentzea guizhouensis TaxID=1586287 RepID=A0A1B2HUD1_9PSEU|nr:TIR domain-containing protein [Lentzea guizhouensis]ANZ41344.1 hypothetical protein BBK82_40665 [Lentzea guizhouensis]
MPEDRYDAFISYSHRADRPVAKAVQRHLHRLGRRWYRPAALRVFRDDTTLTASPDLWASIEEGLAASRTLVVLASPEAAASPWVDREIEWWQTHRGPDTLFVVVTGGELSWDVEANDFRTDRATALPPRLRGYFETQPLWVDLRRHQDAAELRDKAATIAAAVHGVPKDRLLSEEVQRQRQLVSVLSALLVAALVATGTAVWQRGVAVDERDRADEQARIAVSRALAAEADNRYAADPQLASQFAVAAFDTAPTPQAKGALARQFDRDRHVAGYLNRGGGQGADVSEAAFSPDGSLLAHVLYGDTFGKAEVVLWDPRTAAEVGRLLVREPSDDATGILLGDASVALDATGKLLAVDDGEKIQVWDVPGRKLVRSLGVDDDTRLVMSPDGRWVARTASTSIRHRVRMWRTDTGAELAGADVLELSSDQIGFAVDGGLYALSGNFARGRVERFDPVTGQWARAPLMADTPAWGLAVAPGGQVVATSMSDDPKGPAGQMSVIAWNLVTGTSVKQPVGMTVGALAVPDNGDVVVVQTDRSLVGVEMSTGLQTDLARHRADIKNMSITGDGSRLVSVDYGSDVLVSARADNRAVVGPAKTGGTKGDNVYALAASRAGDLATVARGRGEVELWDCPTCVRLRLPVKTDDSQDPRVAVSDDGNRVAVVVDGELTVADGRSGQVLAKSGGPGLPALAGRKTAQARFGAGGRLLVMTADENDDREQVLRVLDPDNGTEEQAFPATVGLSDGGASLDAGNGGGLVAFISDQFQVTVLRWTGTRYEERVKIDDDRGSSNMIFDVALDPSGRRVAFAEQGGRVVVTDLDAPQQLRALPVPDTGGPDVRAMRLAFTADGLLVQASRSFGGFGGIALVDPDSGVLLATWLDGRAVANGRRWIGGADDVLLDRGAANTVVSATVDGRLVHWQLDFTAMRHRLCALAGPLPQEERDRYSGGVPAGPSCAR